MDDSDRKNDSSVNTSDTSDELDYDLLINFLDGLANADLNDTTSGLIKIEPRTELVNQFDSSIYELIIRHVRKNGSAIYSNRVNKPKICIRCKSDNCKHTRQSNAFSSLDHMLETISKSCEHVVQDNWPIDEICIDCLVAEGEKVKVPKTDHLVYIWDHKDFCDYVTWSTNLYNEYGLEN